MKNLDTHGRICEEAFGLISGSMIWMLHEASTAAGSDWDINNPDSMDIIVNRQNAFHIYSICKEIRSGYNVGLNKEQMKRIKIARARAHKFLYEEANDPNTPIERKIELVKLTSKS